MSDRIFGVLDGLVVVAAVLGLAVWQLVSVNREIAKDKRAKADPAESPERPGHPIGEHGLDDR